MEDTKLKRLIFLSAIAIYVISSATAVISAWERGIMPVFELGYTVSVYVGLQRSSAIFYFFCTLAVAILLLVFILKTGIRTVHKISFIISLLFLIGLSWFPVQFMNTESPATKGHAFFSNAFFISVILTLILLFFFSKKKKVKIYSVAGFLYGITFVILYVLDPGFFRSFILIWETVFIYFYIFEYPLADCIGDSKKI